jgi:hypothetical protein
LAVANIHRPECVTIRAAAASLSQREQFSFQPVYSPGNSGCRPGINQDTCIIGVPLMKLAFSDADF